MVRRPRCYTWEAADVRRSTTPSTHLPLVHSRPVLERRPGATAFHGGGRLRSLPRTLLVLLLSEIVYLAVGIGAVAAALRLGVLH